MGDQLPVARYLHDLPGRSASYGLDEANRVSADTSKAALTRARVGKPPTWRHRSRWRGRLKRVPVVVRLGEVGADGAGGVAVEAAAGLV